MHALLVPRLLDVRMSTMAFKTIFSKGVHILKFSNMDSKQTPEGTSPEYRIEYHSLREILTAAWTLNNLVQELCMDTTYMVLMLMKRAVM